MSLSTYAGLQDRLVTLVGDSDFAAADAVDIITLAEARINKEIRHRHMEKALSGTIAAGVMALPSDYVELKHAYVSQTRVVPLQRKTAAWIYTTYPVRSGAEVPRFIARDAGNFIFGPYPGNHSIVGTYFYKFGALSAGLNSLFTDNPDLYLFAALAEAEPVIGRDSRIAIWEAKYEKIRLSVMKEDKDERFSGGPLQITVV